MIDSNKTITAKINTLKNWFKSFDHTHIYIHIPENWYWIKWIWFCSKIIYARLVTIYAIFDWKSWQTFEKKNEWKHGLVIKLLEKYGFKQYHQRNSQEYSYIKEIDILKEC